MTSEVDFNAMAQAVQEARIALEKAHREETRAVNNTTDAQNRVRNAELKMKEALQHAGLVSK